MSYAFFYKSVNGDRVYDDTSFEHWLKKFFTSGVFLNDLQVTANNDMTVTVGAGYTNIDGKVKIFESETPLIIETAGASYPRIDSIVLERNDTERDILLKVIKGGYSSEPVAHVPVRQDGVYQLVIAQILVNAGAVKVTQADITDTRSNTELCGIVAGAVDQIDFSQVQAQFDAYIVQYKKQLEEEHAEHNADMDAYLEQMEAKAEQMEADFAAWFENVRNQLDEDAAGHLQNQIDDINARLEYAGGSMIEITVESNDEEYNVVGLEVNLEIDGKTYTETIPSEKVVKFTGILEVGEAVITCVDEAQEIDTETRIEIPYYGAYECSISFSGSYTKWLEAGGLNPSSYESLDALLEDEAAIRTLMTKKEAVDVLARMSGDDLTTIINHRYVAKWVNYREYAYSTLSANEEIKAIMDASGMYGMYITMKEPEALIPKMTSNTAPSGYEAKASSNSGEYYPYKAFSVNFSESNCWHSSSEINGAWLQIRFPSYKTVSYITLTNRNRSDAVHPIKEFILQGSNDGSSWNDLGTFTNTKIGANETSTFIVNNYDKHLYYRIYVISNHGSNSVAINELQLYGYEEDETLWQPKGLVPVMTSNTAPYGEAFASTVVEAANAAYKAFDNDNTTHWGSTHGDRAKAYIGYKFNSPANVKKVYVLALHSEKEDACRLKDIVIEGSNDGSNYTTIYSTTYEITPSADIGHTYTFDNEDYYLYYRVRQVGESYSGSYSTSVYTLQFYGTQLKALIPTMTSNTTPIGEVSASSLYNSTNYNEWKAFDDDITSRWISSKHDGAQYIQYEFNNPTVVNSIKIGNSSSGDEASFVKSFDLLGSNDGTQYETIYSGEHDKNDKGIIYYHAFDNSVAYKYYRVLCKTSFGSYDQIATIQFYGTPDYESRTYIYEHGVELMELTTSGTVTKSADCITLAAANSIATVTLDTTSYSILQGNAGCNASGTNALVCGSGSANFTTTTMPKNTLDITSINDSNDTGIKQTAVGTFDCVELWIE